MSIGRPRCSASAWPSDFPSDGRRVGPGAPTSRFENSHEKRWAPRNSETRVAVRSGANGRPIHSVKRCWIQPAADTLQLPRFLAGMRGEVAERQRLAGVVPREKAVGVVGGYQASNLRVGGSNPSRRAIDSGNLDIPSASPSELGDG